MATKPNIYRPGETVEVTGNITDKDNALANPTVSTVARIADPDGTVQAEAQAMSNEGTGLYFFAYALAESAEIGTWTYEVIATDGAGSDVTIGSGTFTVKARAIVPV